MTSPLAILGAQLQELDLRSIKSDFAVIYLLVAGDEIVYVGQSTRFAQRIGAHLYGDGYEEPKEFDRVLWFACPHEERLRYEGALIRAFRPQHNVHAPAWHGRDNETLRELGLPEHTDEEANVDEWFRLNPRTLGPLSDEEKAFRFRHRYRTQQCKRIARLFAGIEAAWLAQRSAS